MKKILLVAVVMMTVFASCNKEEELPEPQARQIVAPTPSPTPTPTPTPPPAVDISGHIGAWELDSAYYHYPSGGGFTYELDRGTVTFTGSSMTWYDGTVSNYTVSSDTINSDTLDFRVLLVDSNTMVMENLDPAALGFGNDEVRYYYTK